jgi:PII-like signaling protein
MAAIALAAGVILGYGVRGEPAPAGLITEERDVPVVTLTVEAP